MQRRTGYYSRAIPRGSYGMNFEDEFEAELGGEYVVGARDDRFHIPARPGRPSTLLFPFNTICFLEADLGDGRFIPWCSGTLIAPQVVLTAKHCLINVPPFAPCSLQSIVGNPLAQIRVSPGADLSATRVAQQRPSSPSSLIAPGRRVQVSPNLDYGAIFLPTAFRSPNRFMRLQARGRTNTATLLTLAGYPCDKPVGTMWGHSDRIPLAGVTDTHLSYPLDTCPGHSGSPVWLLGNDDIRILLGVHTGGVNQCLNDPVLTRCRPTGAAVTPVAGGLNCGVRITCQVIRNILVWCREFNVQRPVIDSFSLLCGAPLPPVRAPHPVLRRGSSGQAVRELQGLLNTWMALSPLPRLSLLVDGGFGTQTEVAVRAFQAERGLIQDGVVGQQVWGALQTQ